jgi:DDE superfamily endonuclease
VASSQVLAELTPRYRAEQFRRFLNLIDTSVPGQLEVHVVLDNSSTHKTPSIQRWLSATRVSASISHRPTASGSDSPRRLVRGADDEVRIRRFTRSPND